MKKYTYKNLEYLDKDFTICSGFSGKRTAKIQLHPNTKEVCDYAFVGEKIEEVKLNEGLEIIREKAFEECSVLTKINFPASLKSIGEDAFVFCNIESIDLSKCNSIILNLGSFYSNRAKKLVLPQTITYIPVECFGNNDFETIDLPNSLERIDARAFEGCEFLKTLDTKNVKIINLQAFGDCKKLKEINFNSKLEEIEEYAFCDCNSLINVNLNKTNITTLKSFVFDKCKHLNKIILPSTIEILEKDCLRDTLIKTIMLPTQKEIKNFDPGITIKKPTIDNLLEDNMSFREINNLLKNKEEAR